MKVAGQTIRKARKTGDQTPRHSRRITKTGNLLDRVIVPVDFSVSSLRALDYALPLAEASKAMLQLVHVVEPAPFLAGLDTVPIVVSDPEAAAQCEHELAKVARRYCSPEVPISSEVHIGKPAHEICKI